MKLYQENKYLVLVSLVSGWCLDRTRLISLPSSPQSSCILSDCSAGCGASDNSDIMSPLLVIVVINTRPRITGELLEARGVGNLPSNISNWLQLCLIGGTPRPRLVTKNRHVT